MVQLNVQMKKLPSEEGRSDYSKTHNEVHTKHGLEPGRTKSQKNVLLTTPRPSGISCAGHY